MGALKVLSGVANDRLGEVELIAVLYALRVGCQGH